MIKQNPQILLQSIAAWFAFNCIFLFSIFYLEHSLPGIIGINCSISFALGLLALNISRNEEFNKDVFTNIGILFIWNASSTLAILWLQSFFNGQSINSNINFYHTLSIPLLTAFVVIYLGLKYLLPKMNSYFLYLISLLISGFIIGFNCGFTGAKFSTFFTDLSALATSIARVYGLVLLLILVYATKVYIKDKPTGEYLHLLMIGFFFLILRNLIDYLSHTYFPKYTDENQYLVLMNLLFLMTILLKKLNYSLSEFGKFYERQIYGVNKLHDIMLVRRGKGNLNFYLKTGKQLFYHPMRITIILLLGVILQTLVQWSFYLTLNITIHFASIILIFLFALHLYQKRLRKGNLV